MKPPITLGVRRLRLLLIYALLLIPVILHGALQAMQSNSNSPLDWVPGSFHMRAEYDAFVEKFGPGDAVILSWDGCTIDEPRLDRLVQTFRQSKHFHDRDGNWFFDRVSSGREIATALMSGDVATSREDAIRRLSGSLIGPDGLTTCVVITFTAAALPERAHLVKLIESATSAICEVPTSELHLAGPVIDGLCVDVAGKSSIDRLALPSAAVVLVVACLILRSWKLGFIVFGLSVYCQGATLALVHFGGETMSALLIVLPPLIEVLAVAGGVHLVNYYAEASRTYSPERAPWEAVRMGWLPCLLSAGTTALGIGSLMVSQLIPIRAFGVFGSAGVVMTAGLLLAVIPGMLLYFPVRMASANPIEGSIDGHRGGWWRLSALLQANAGLTIVVFLAIMVAGGFGILRLQTSVRIETLFPPHSKIIADYNWLESHIGPLVPIEVIVSCPAANSDHSQTVPPEVVRLVQSELARLPEIGSTFSALNLLPPQSALEQFPPPLRPQAKVQFVQMFRDQSQAAGWLAASDGEDFWRISANVSSLSTIDYGRFLEKVRATVDPVIARADAPDTEVQYTGIMPLVHEIQRQLMLDLFISFAEAVILITLVMTLTLGSIPAGLIAMLPNLFPILLLFGILGWAGIPLDIGTVMTASVAIGIAVDDTLHFLTFYQQSLEQLGTRRAATLHAFRHCGRAMLQTTIICTSGLLVFGFSEFVPTSRFGLMMAGLLAAALLGDLVLLPALLMSPWGRHFGEESATDPQTVPSSAMVSTARPMALEAAHYHSQRAGA